MFRFARRVATRRTARQALIARPALAPLRHVARRSFFQSPSTAAKLQPALMNVVALSSAPAGSQANAAPLIKVGDKFPKVTLYEKTGQGAVDTEELLRGKKVIIFGVPGAFTPACVKTHLPGYLDNYQAYKAKGIDHIVCVSVNDPFVMDAWGQSHNVGDKIKMLADTHCQLTEKLGLVLHLDFLGNPRMKRFSAFIDNGVVKILNIEENGTGLTCSLAEPLLAAL